MNSCSDPETLITSRCSRHSTVGRYCRGLIILREFWRNRLRNRRSIITPQRVQSGSIWCPSPAEGYGQLRKLMGSGADGVLGGGTVGEASAIRIVTLAHNRTGEGFSN